MNETNENIKAKYDAMPDLQQDYGWTDLKFGMSGFGFCMLVLLIAVGAGHHVDNAMDEMANTIYHIQADKLSCSDLTEKIKTLSIYLMSDRQIMHVVYDRMVGDGCMSYAEQQTILDDEWCKLNDTVSCRVKAIAEKNQNHDTYIPRGKR